MGLAPYGEPRYVEAIRENIVDLKDDGSVWLDMTYFNYCQGLTMTSDKFHKLFGGPPRNPESVITQKEMDLAASVQAITEDAVLRSARFAYKLHGSRNLVMAGGVALNCVANGRVRREGPFENIWIQPAAGDAGGALGAALLVWYHKLQNTRHPKPLDAQRASFLGPSFTNDEIGRFLDADGARYEYLDDEKLLIDKVASLLAQEKVVGWFHGSMEFGPRALGRRSILGDARSSAMQQKMNLKIKFRESFRPFAPSVLRECVDQIFEVPPGEDTPYMLFVAPVRKNLRVPLSAEDLARMKDPDLRIRVSIPRSTLPAITHVDYSARIQTVDEERHGRYYRLMRRFYELTGCPVIVNTSFNVRGEPIVNLPEDAYQCFLATDMDCLVLENHVLVKEDQVPALLDSGKRHRTNYISTFSLD
jgi:carbamoyltransferase